MSASQTRSVYATDRSLALADRQSYRIRNAVEQSDPDHNLGRLEDSSDRNLGRPEDNSDRVAIGPIGCPIVDDTIGQDLIGSPFFILFCFLIYCLKN